MVLFTGATSRVTTYATNRVPALDPPAADGTVVLDFNRAANLPFGYTDLANLPGLSGQPMSLARLGSSVWAWCSSTLFR
jgi:uncharacterized protein (DUF1684 family)